MVPIPGGTDYGASLKCAAGRGTGSFLKIYANLSIVRPPCSLYPFERPAGGVIQVPFYYSNHQNSWQKFGGTKRAWLRCRPWRASARLHPPPCPARFVLPSFFVMNSEACYRLDARRTSHSRGTQSIKDSAHSPVSPPPRRRDRREAPRGRSGTSGSSDFLVTFCSHKK